MHSRSVKGQRCWKRTEMLEKDRDTRAMNAQEWRTWKKRHVSKSDRVGGHGNYRIGRQELYMDRDGDHGRINDL